MRITNNMMVQTMIRNMNRNMNRLNDRQIQMSTGKRINKPSDDPLGIAKTLRLRTDISTMEQYGRNVDDAHGFMDNTETAIRNMLDGMHRVRELTVQASSETLTREETQKIKTEIQEIRSQLTDLANSTYSEKQLFSGKKTTTSLLDGAGFYQMDQSKAQDARMRDDQWDVEVSSRERVQVNTLGMDLFEREERALHRTRLPDNGEDWTLELPLRDDDGTFELTVEAGSDAGPERSEEGEWTVGADWEGTEEDPPADAGELITQAMETIGESVGTQVGSYSFSTTTRNVVDTEEDPPTVEEDVAFLEAVPDTGMILDEHTSPAVFHSGELGAPDFDADRPQSLQFGGVEIQLQPGDPEEADQIHVPDQPLSQNRITLTVDGDPEALSQEDYTAAYTEALNLLSAQRDSPVAGYTFSPQEVDGELTGIQAVAPEADGTLPNRTYFAGTVTTDETTPKEQQLVVPGAAPTRYVTENRQAGLFRMLDEMEHHLEAGNQEELSHMLDEMDGFLDRMLTARSTVGARSSRMELVKNRIEDDTLNYRELISSIEDADLSEVIIELMNEENVYRSALGVGARIIQPTLLDFLR